MFVNIGGIEKKGVGWVNVGGIWKQGKAVWYNDGGVWKAMLYGIPRIFVNYSNAIGFKQINTTINGFASDPEGRRVLAYGNKDEMRYSLDGGLRFIQVPFVRESSVYDVTSAVFHEGEQRFYIGYSDGKVFRTSNPLQSWEEVTQVSDSAVVGLAYSTSGLFRIIALTRDGEADDVLSASDNLPKGLNSGAVGARCIAANGNLVVAGFDDGYASLSTDGGVSFFPLPRGLQVLGARPNITDVAIKGDLILAGMADQYASVSKDGGQTWTPIPRGFGFPSSDFVDHVSVAIGDDDYMVALMSNGQGFQSFDQGSSWEQLPRGLNSGFLSPSTAVIDSVGDYLLAGFNLGYAARGNKRED